MDQIRFPRFWSKNPALWFAQVEAVFSLNGILSDSDKYDYIITELDSDIVSIVEDIILDPPGENVDDKYGYLKREIIKRLSIAHLEKEELGGKIPSVFLQHLRKIAHQRIPDETVCKIWLKNLPKHVQDIVVLESSGNMEVLSKMADKVLEVIPTLPIHSTELPYENATKCLQQLEQIQVQLNKLQEAVYGSHHISPCKTCKTESEENTIYRDRNQNTPQRNYCWYHINFAEKASKCVAPCTFREKNTTQDLFNVTSS